MNPSRRAGQIWERGSENRRPPHWYLCLGITHSRFGYDAYLLLSLDGPYGNEGVLIERAKFCLDDPLPPNHATQRWTRVA